MSTAVPAANCEYGTAVQCIQVPAGGDGVLRASAFVLQELAVLWTGRSTTPPRQKTQSARVSRFSTRSTSGAGIGIGIGTEGVDRGVADISASVMPGATADRGDVDSIGVLEAGPERYGLVAWLRSAQLLLGEGSIIVGADIE